MSEGEFGIADVQDVFLRCVSRTRDEIAKTIGSVEHPDHSIATLKSFFFFIGGRSQSISFLLFNGYLWDAEIVLRSFYEANAKIWFICYRSPESRKLLIEEFWGDFAEMHNQKKISRSAKALDMANRFGSQTDSEILSTFQREDIFSKSTENKAKRRELEGKWSFSEIIRYLENNSKDFSPLDGVAGLSHMYGMQSHLCHADDVALDLMYDHATRNSEENRLKDLSHVCRILSDVASLWLFSLEAMQFSLGIGFDRKSEVWSLWKELHSKTKPFKESFEQSQRAFYDSLARQTVP